MDDARGRLGDHCHQCHPRVKWHANFAWIIHFTLSLGPSRSDTKVSLSSNQYSEDLSNSAGNKNSQSGAFGLKGNKFTLQRPLFHINICYSDLHARTWVYGRNRNRKCLRVFSKGRWEIEIKILGDINGAFGQLRKLCNRKSASFLSSLHLSLGLSRWFLGSPCPWPCVGPINMVAAIVGSECWIVARKFPLEKTPWCLFSILNLMDSHQPSSHFKMWLCEQIPLIPISSFRSINCVCECVCVSTTHTMYIQTKNVQHWDSILKQRKKQSLKTDQKTSILDFDYGSPDSLKLPGPGPTSRNFYLIGIQWDPGHSILYISSAMILTCS